jgi:hypothetical protein
MNNEIKDKIIEVVRDIFSQGTFVVETYSEQILVELMQANNTPITNYKDYRDDFEFKICEVCGEVKSSLNQEGGKIFYSCLTNCQSL